MTTADWALIISLFSFGISVLGFIWSVWSKFIFPKPKVEVRMSYMQTTDQPFKKAICLSAVNHGPIEATLKMGILKSAHFGLLNTRFAEHAILKPHTSFPYNMEDFHPFGGGLPKKLAVGEEFSVYLSSKLNWPKRYHVLVGFVDTFGRNHFASKKNFVSTISQQETMKNNV